MLTTKLLLLVTRWFICFMTRKHTLLAAKEKKMIEIKAVEPCAIRFEKGNVISMSEKTRGR